jgi:hypothetical protein
VFGTVLSAAGLLLTVAPGGAAAADARQAPGLIAKASVSRSQGHTVPAAQIPDRATARCLPGANGEVRFFSCVPLIGEVIFYVVQNGVRVPVGDITFQVEQTVETKVKSTTVTESDFIYAIKEFGTVEPTGLSEVVACGTGCRGAAHLPVALIEGKTYLYTLRLVNSIGPGAVRRNTPTYVWTFTVGNPDTTSGRTWRCDDKLETQQRAGCVYATFIPTVSMAGLKFITPSIKAIQAKGGPRQLHRNSHLKNSNRNAVCRGVPAPGWTPPPGWPQPVSDPDNKPSCDEYPFATSWEGGTRLPASQRGVAVVPLGEQNSQGGRLGAFYLANRVLDATSAKTKGDVFNVTT